MNVAWLTKLTVPEIFDLDCPFPERRHSSLSSQYSLRTTPAALPEPCRDQPHRRPRGRQQDSSEKPPSQRMYQHLHQEHYFTDNRLIFNICKQRNILNENSSLLHFFIMIKKHVPKYRIIEKGIFILYLIYHIFINGCKCAIV